MAKYLLLVDQGIADERKYPIVGATYLVESELEGVEYPCVAR